MKTNHEANFMNALVGAKLKSGVATNLFEWDATRNRWESDVVESGWQGYCLAVLHLTGEYI